MHQSATNLEIYVRQLLELFAESGLENHNAYKELKAQFIKGKVIYSNRFVKYQQSFILNDSESVTKITKMFESRNPKAKEEDMKDNLSSRVYQSMSFEDLTDLNDEKLALHALLDSELRIFAANIMSIWFSLFTPLFALHQYLVPRYRKTYRTNKQERVLQQIIGSKEVDAELGAYNKEDVGTLHKNIARSKRNSGFFKQLLEFNSQKVEDEKYYEKADLVPIVFEETFIRFENAESMLEMSTDDGIDETTVSLNDLMIEKQSINETSHTKQKNSYIFLSHGFQASHYDMLKIKHYFSNYRQDARFVCIKANEDDTTGDIRELGSNFAKEVAYVLEKEFIAHSIESVSFIGHSLGMSCLNRWAYY